MLTLRLAVFSNLLSCVVASAGVIEYNLAFDNVVSTYEPASSQVIEKFEPVGGVPLLNGNFGVDKQLRITYTAQPVSSSR